MRFILSNLFHPCKIGRGCQMRAWLCSRTNDLYVWSNILVFAEIRWNGHTLVRQFKLHLEMFVNVSKIGHSHGMMQCQHPLFTRALLHPSSDIILYMTSKWSASWIVEIIDWEKIGFIWKRAICSLNAWFVSQVPNILGGIAFTFMQNIMSNETAYVDKMQNVEYSYRASLFKTIQNHKMNIFKRIIPANDVGLFQTPSDDIPTTYFSANEEITNSNNISDLEIPTQCRGHLGMP